MERPVTGTVIATQRPLTVSGIEFKQPASFLPSSLWRYKRSAYNTNILTRVFTKDAFGTRDIARRCSMEASCLTSCVKLHHWGRLTESVWGSVAGLCYSVIDKTRLPVCLACSLSMISNFTPPRFCNWTYTTIVDGRRRQWQHEAQPLYST